MNELMLEMEAARDRMMATREAVVDCMRELLAAGEAARRLECDRDRAQAQAEQIEAMARLNVETARHRRASAEFVRLRIACAGMPWVTR